MKMAMRTGGFQYSLNEKSYEVINPEEFLMNLFTYPEYPKNFVDLIMINLVGSMGSGKSTMIDHICFYLHQIYQDQISFYKTHDLVYALKHGIEQTSFVQVIIIDDALTSSFDSRRSMSSANVNMSENVAIGRHLAVKKMGKGILIIIFAIQDPMRLDAFIRRNVDLTLYKTYYPFLDTIIKDDLQIQFIKDATEEAMLKHNFNARGSSLGVDRINRSFQFFLDKVPKELVPPIQLIIPKNIEFDALERDLMRLPLADMKEGVIKGFVENWSDLNHINLNQNDVSKLIRKCMYMQYVGLESDSENSKPKIDYRDVIIQNELLGIKWDDLARKYDVPRTTLYDNCMRYKERLLQLQNA